MGGILQLQGNSLCCGFGEAGGAVQGASVAAVGGVTHAVAAGVAAQS